MYLNPPANNAFINAINEKPILLLINLKKLGELKVGDKLVFNPNGKIEIEEDSNYRSGVGLFTTYVYNYYSTSREIINLDLYAKAFWSYYRVHVIPSAELHDTVYNIQQAMNGFLRLRLTYEIQGENKKTNIEVVNKAVEAFKAVLPHIIKQSVEKSNKTLNEYAKVFCQRRSEIHLADRIKNMAPLIDDSMEELLAIEGDPEFTEIQRIYRQTPHLRSDQDKKRALAEIMLTILNPLPAFGL